MADSAVTLDELVGAICNCTINADELVQLESILQAQADARRRYRQYMELHADLHWRESARVESIEQKPGSSLILTLRQPLPKWHLSPRMVAAMVCGILISYFAGLACFVSFRNRYDRTVAGVNSDAPVVARVTGVHGCVWDTARTSNLQGDLQAYRGQDLLAIRSGIAEVTFENGAKVLLAGPAEFRLEASNRGHLESGKLVAFVTERATGFTVATSDVEVIDLGTEFGVEIDDTGKSSVEVLKGEVIVKTGNAAGQTPESNVRLVAGQAVRVSKGGPAVLVPTERKRFDGISQSIATFRSPGKPTGDTNPTNQARPASFFHDFNDQKIGYLLELGRGGGDCRVDLSTGKFKILARQGNRIYVGTRWRDYAKVDFVYEVTVTMPPGNNPWSDPFFGMGVTDVVGNVREPAAPNVLAVIRLDRGDDRSCGFETRDSVNENSFKGDTSVDVAPRLSDTTVRLRMTWNAATRQALFELDADYTTGPFVADYQLTVDGSDNGLGPWNSQLIFGGGEDLEFDDMKVTVLEAPPDTSVSSLQENPPLPVETEGR
jgi:hypothetical protein